MKNFFKKLSFVLAIAMVLTTLAPATASAAAKNYAKVNGKKAATTTAFIGGVERKIVPYFNGKTSKSVTVSYSKEGIAKVENNGVVKPLKNGTTVVTFKSGKNAVKVTVKVRTRAKALNIYDRAEYKEGKKDKLTTVELKVGEKKDLQVTMPIYAKAKKAGAVKSSYYTYASSSDDAVVKVNKLGNGQRHFEVEALAAGTAKVTIVANQRTLKNVKVDDYWVGASFDVTVKDEKIEAKQTGKNTITVEGTDLTDKTADYVVKRGNTTVALSSATLSEDKKSVKLVTASKNPVAGDYKVTFKEATAEFKMEAEVVTSIKFLDEIAVLETGVTSKAAVEFDILNQWEERVVLNAADVQITTSCDGDANTSTNVPTATANGKIVFGKTAGFNTVLDKVVATVVYKKTGVNANATFEIGAEAKPDTVEILGFYEKKDNGDFVAADLKEGTVAAGKYYLVASIKSQYGKDLFSTAITKDNVAMNVTAPLANVIVKVDSTDDVNATVSGVPFGVAYPVSAGSIGAGEVNVIAVVLTSGKTASKTFTVAAATTVVSLELTPSDNLYVGKETEVNYVALDADGKEVTDFATLNAQVVTTDSNSASLRFEKQADGSAKLYVTPAAKNMVVVAKSSKNKFYKTFIWTAGDACVAKAILGFKADAALGTISGETLTFKVKDLRVEDQYGNEMKTAEVIAAVSNGAVRLDLDANTAASGYTLTPHFNLTAASTGEDDLLEVRTVGKASQKITLMLLAENATTHAWDVVAGSDCDVTVKSFDIEDCSNFAVEDLGLVQAGKTKAIKVTAQAGGMKVVLPDDAYTFTVSSTASSHGAIVAPANDPANDAKVTEFEASYQITIANKAGTAVAFKANVSEKAAVPTTAELKSGARIVAGAAPINVEALLDKLTIKDQYGNTLTAASLKDSTLVTVSNFTKDASISGNGTKSLTYGDNDTTAHFKFVFAGGFTFETDITVY